MGGRVHGYRDPDGSFREVKPADIYKSEHRPPTQPAESQNGLKPLDLQSLGAEDDSETMSVFPPSRGTKITETARLDPNTAVMGFSTEQSDQLRAERDAAIAKWERQNSATRSMEAPGEKTLMSNASDDQTVVYRRQPGGASEHQLPTEKTAIVDLNKMQGLKRPSPPKPPTQPLWSRIKRIFSKSA